jgi:hypothetical protein
MALLNYTGLWRLLYDFQTIITGALAIGSVFLGAKLAFSRFRQERVWERKETAYTAIFGALYDMGRWFDEHWQSIEAYAELPEDRKAQLTADYQTARAALARRLASEAWVIPKVCRERLDKMTSDLLVRGGQDWVEHVESGDLIITTARDDLLSLVRKDLKLRRSQLPGGRMRWIVLILLGVVAACVAGYVFLVLLRPSATPRVAATMPVYPRDAADLPVTNLSDLVVAVIPAHGFNGLGWDDMIDSPMIRWTTDGVTVTGTSAALRQGLVRVRVDGKPSTTIHQVREELAWTVTLGTYGPEKFGPQWISVEPGVEPHDQCFGALDDGCTFSSAQALAAPTLTKQLICDVAEFGGQTQVYSVTASGKAPVLLIHTTSGGSGGSSSSIEIRPLSDRTVACKSSP